MSLTGDRVAAQLRPRLCRKKTGCLCCRIRRKKCDEHKPTCNACTRNNLICSWPRPPGDVQSEASSAFAWRIKLRSGEYTPETSASSSHAGENDSEDQTKQMVAISQRTRPQQVIRPLSNHPHNILSDQGSCLLYQHFVQRTAPRLVASVPANNPLLRFVLPLATSNSMVLHAALAISGAHYCHKYGSMQYKTKTLAHCQSALQKLKQALTTWEWGDTSNTLIMLLTTLLLCQYEAVAGNSESSAYYHLRASREFIIHAIKSPLHGDEQILFGFLLEIYSYFAIVKNLTYTLSDRTRLVISDPFVRTLRHLEQYQTYGTMFGCAAEIYEIIPSICLLETQPDEVDEIGKSQRESSYLQLERRIHEWRPPELIPGHGIPSDEQKASARIYQIATLIFFYASNNQLHHLARYSSTPDVQSLVDEALRLLLSLSNSALSTTLLWPILIIGSSIRLQGQQQAMLGYLEKTDYEMPIVARAVDVLEQTWSAVPSDGEAHEPGPARLGIVLRNPDLRFAMS